MKNKKIQWVAVNTVGRNTMFMKEAIGDWYQVAGKTNKSLNHFEQ